jgi:myo-inositol-1(or 4)-monophosphatase
MENRFLEAVIHANEEIVSTLEAGYDKDFFRRGERGAGGDLTSGLDLFAESVFVKHLSCFGAIESEESGRIGEGKDTIIIDPIDGSSNALSLFPYFGTSVARIDADGILDTAVVSNLANRDLFVKEVGKPLLQGKLFGTKLFPARSAVETEIGLFEKAYAHPEIVAHLNSIGLKFRSPGAVALSLAYARSVGYLLFVGPYRIYDFAAGLSMCEDLEVIVEEEYVIVSKDKEIALQLESIVKASMRQQKNEG